MFSLGISPGDGLKILKYHESAWFIKEIIKIKQKNDITTMINTAEAVRRATFSVTSKKNLKLYENWLNELHNKIADPVESGEETLFDQLKKQSKPKNKVLTFFERLKMK